MIEFQCYEGSTLAIKIKEIVGFQYFPDDDSYWIHTSRGLFRLNRKTYNKIYTLLIDENGLRIIN